MKTVRFWKPRRVIAANTVAWVYGAQAFMVIDLVERLGFAEKVVRTTVGRIGPVPMIPLHIVKG